MNDDYRLGELKTHRSYEWTKKEKTDQGKSLTEIVEMVSDRERELVWGDVTGGMSSSG